LKLKFFSGMAAASARAICGRVGASTGEHEARRIGANGDKNPVPLARAFCRQLRMSMARDRGKPSADRTQPTSAARFDARLIELDGTPNKGRLGANGDSRGFRWAAARASAKRLRPATLFANPGWGSGRTTLPVPMMNILNGGRGIADNNVDFPGVHGDAGGRAIVFRGAALGRRSFSYASKAC